MKPIYPHDCDGCSLLGTYGTLRDMYYCQPKSHSEPILILRYGSAPEENTSFILRRGLPIPEPSTTIDVLAVSVAMNIILARGLPTSAGSDLPPSRKERPETD